QRTVDLDRVPRMPRAGRPAHVAAPRDAVDGVDAGTRGRVATDDQPPNDERIAARQLTPLGLRGQPAAQHDFVDVGVDVDSLLAHDRLPSTGRGSFARRSHGTAWNGFVDSGATVDITPIDLGGSTFLVDTAMADYPGIVAAY